MQTPQQYKMSRTSSVQDDIDEIVKNKNKMLIDDSRQLVNSLKHNKKSRLSYTKLKHEGIIYHKGQNLCIKADNKQEYVAKLVRILLLVDDEDRHYPLIKVQWYCKKNELKNVTKEQLDCISDNEVFKTNEFDYIEIDSIISLAQILTYQEFDQLEIMNDTTYFTRATFQNAQFSPPLEQWEKTCICQKPPNPDLKYILCDACEKWFHLKCVDITKDKAERLKAYICPNCQS